jgi:2-polyprenyl-3-methyl-5-hydroxy-6-metoxy-1,4-benzoquinol methylase
METSRVNTLNEKYYNNLYKGKNKVLNLIHPLVSYDQQSKSKANYYFVRNLVRDEGYTVLDYGFGHGSFLLKFSKRCTLFGVDISEEAVTNFPKTARFFGKTAVTSLPDDINKIIPPGSLDLICLSHVLEHVENDKAILDQLSKYLSHNGHLLINIPINEVWKDPKHVRAYDLRIVESLLSELDFKIVNYFMFDKTTAFLLDHEYNRKINRFKKFSLRLLRLLLSFASFNTYKLIDKYIFKNYLNQQLVVLAQKK